VLETHAGLFQLVSESSTVALFLCFVIFVVVIFVFVFFVAVLRLWVWWNCGCVFVVFVVMYVCMFHCLNSYCLLLCGILSCFWFCDVICW